MSALVKFHVYFGRMGVLSGLFIAPKEDVEACYGRKVYFDEALGKHSEIEFELGPEHFTFGTEDDAVIQSLISSFGDENIVGYNPLEFISGSEDDDE